ncbi:hypothetical protein BpHYR1_039038 [Brachionus plicatilis]|uniref:Uncharacterized protein n=1 Tax=Brachionus plicatilis TaxID=10195 RepID=A0A3M7R3Y4_BRAPC|nr:hypothetical protein BpHYR1_039038 [Brachionus plicatilis]
MDAGRLRSLIKNTTLKIIKSIVAMINHFVLYFSLFENIHLKKVLFWFFPNLFSNHQYSLHIGSFRFIRYK